MPPLLKPVFCIVLFLVLVFLFSYEDRDDLPLSGYSEFAIAVVVAVLASIFGPTQIRWLWQMSKWVMGRHGYGPREGPQYEPSDPRQDAALKRNIGSLSHLRAIRRPELWVVASGKGGVGKSLLSLGITESVSQTGPVLLVDFDLHNRGLTSVLVKDASSVQLGSKRGTREDWSELQETTFSLLGHFHELLRTAPEDSSYFQLLKSQWSLPEGFSHKHFSKLAQKYAREVRLEMDAWGDIGDEPLLTPKLISFDQGKSSKTPRRNVKLYGKNVMFLPSRDRKESFLLSQQSSCSFVIVSIFLQAFAAWINETTSAATIVLDCHGAHDDLTAGAIVAADKLVVVTTTDPGSYDGTHELLSFLAQYREKDLPTVVALNNCRSWDGRFNVADSAFRNFEPVLDMRGVIHVPHEADIRGITSAYSYGDISCHRVLWDQVNRIVQLLRGEREVVPQTQAGQGVNPEMRGEMTDARGDTAVDGEGEMKGESGDG